MDPVKPAHFLFAAAALHPTRAESARRFVLATLAGAGDPAAGLDELAEAAAATLAGPPPRDDHTALRRLLAEDLQAILDRRREVLAEVAPWGDPRAAATAAAGRIAGALERIGVAVEPPPLHFVRRLLPPYDPPSLAVVSIDRADAAAFGIPPGLHLREDRLAPLATELALGHVLVHAALGQRSPRELGRGLEEGLAEVLGSLHAAAVATSPEAAERAFAALRLTPSLVPHREQQMAWTRAAALLLRQLGLAGIAHLVDSGRGAVKAAEAATGRSRPAEARRLVAGRKDGDPGLSDDPGLGERLDRLLGAPRPVAVRPLAFFLARSLRAGGRVDDTARQLGVPAAAAAAAAADLVDRAFVLVLGPDGDVLVDDLDLVLAGGGLRYAVPVGGAVGHRGRGGRRGPGLTSRAQGVR